MNALHFDPARTLRQRPSAPSVTLDLRYAVHADGVALRCDAFPIVGAWLDVPFETWKDWSAVRLRVMPEGRAPRTDLLLTDLHGRPLHGADLGPVRRIGKLELDLQFVSGRGMAFTLVLAGPGHLTSLRVFMGLTSHNASDQVLAELDLLPEAPRVRRAV